VTALLIAALFVPGSLSSRLSTHAQELETQAAGNLDPAFGNGGRAIADFAGKETGGGQRGLLRNRAKWMHLSIIPQRFSANHSSS